MATTMITKGRALAHMYPGHEGDFEVRLDEEGNEVIARWDLASLGVPRPTNEEIEAAKLGAAKALKRSELKVAFKNQYEPTFEAGFLEVDYIMDRLRRGLAVPQAERDRLQGVGAGIDKLRALFAQVSAATTIGEVEGIAWT
jgi:hypothetical protein